MNTVQARLRHANASTTLDVYGHLWPDGDESTRRAADAALNAALRYPADNLRTDKGG